MKKYIYLLFLALLAACAKDALWNQDSEIPDSKKGTIIGQLINDDNNQPLKGVKILFERQTQADGTNSYIDTVSTDTEGKFSYTVPFPNKVRLVVRDTGRYAADTTYIEVLENKEYNVTMNSHPRFGVMPIKVHVNDSDFGVPFEDIHVSLWVRESNNESYSMVESILTDEEGNVQFEDIAWPVNYEVRIEEDPELYAIDKKSGKITTKDPLELTLDTERLFGQTTISATVLDENSVPFAWDVKVALYLRQSEDDEYVKEVTLTTDAEGKVLFENVDFPAQYKIELDEKSMAYDYEVIEDVVNKQRREVEETLTAKSNFGVANVQLQGWWYFQNQGASGESILVSYKSVLDDDFSAPETLTLNGSGEYTLPDFAYPAEVKIMKSPSSIRPFKDITLVVNETNASSIFRLDLLDFTPRYWNMTPSSVMAENTLVAFYDGVKVQEMELDSKGNIYAVTTDNMLVRILHDGSGHKVLATGFTESWGIALQDDYTMYVVENTGGHSVKKVVINPATDVATVTLFAGNGSSSGTTDGIGEVARFNRPGDAVYDPSRNCLWVVEWTGQRIRKIDLETAEVSTVATGTGYGFGVGITSDYKYLYIAAHTGVAVPQGVIKYDIESNKLYVVRSGYSIRHIAVAPNDDVYFNINGNYQGKQYKITNEVLVENASNTVSTFETIVSNGSWGTLPPIGYSGSPNISVGTGNVDGSPNGMTYDPNRGRLYFSISADSRLYYLRSSTVPED